MLLWGGRFIVQILFLLSLTICVFAQESKYVALLKAIRDSNPSLPKDCFAGLDSVVTLNDVNTYCQSTLQPKFDPNNAKYCLASVTAGKPKKRAAGSSSISDELLKSVIEPIAKSCYGAVDDINNANSSPFTPPAGPNPAYTGNTQAISDFVASSKLNVDRAILVKSLSQASIVVKRDTSALNIPGMVLSGGFANGVVIQVILEGISTMTLQDVMVFDSRAVNVGTGSSGNFAFTLDASVNSFWIGFALSPASIGNIFVLNVLTGTTSLISYKLTLDGLKETTTDVNLTAVIGGAPLLNPAVTTLPLVTSAFINATITVTTEGQPNKVGTNAAEVTSTTTLNAATTSTLVKVGAATSEKILQPRVIRKKFCEMQVLFLLSLAICVFAQESKYVALFKAIRDNNPSFPKDCFAGLDSVVTLNDVITYCRDTLQPNFNYAGAKYCLASVTTGKTKKRAAASSSISDELLKSVIEPIAKSCFGAVDDFNNANSSPFTPPAGPNPAYTGNTQAISDFVASSKLNVDRAILVKSLAEASLLVKRGFLAQNVPGSTFTGSFAKGVVIQIIVEGCQLTFQEVTSDTSSAVNVGTGGSGTIAFTLDTSVKSFWLNYNLSPSSIGRLLFVNIYYDGTNSIMYKFTVDGLKDTITEVNIAAIIGAAPLIASIIKTSTISQPSLTVSGLLSASTINSSTVSQPSLTVSGLLSASTINSSTVSQPSLPTTTTQSTSLISSSTSMALSSGATSSFGFTTSASPSTTPISTNTSTTNIQIKVGAAQTLVYSLAAFIGSTLLL
ncbi:hypothetical protein HDU79_005709 [Rhizoclosmatium sp. JEL0117]|nr:hypothetical protein HDU79_005709 [Rhizoclosmatium sp. JEL0117]